MYEPVVSENCEEEEEEEIRGYNLNNFFKLHEEGYMG